MIVFFFLAKPGKTPQRKGAATPGAPVEGVRSYSDRPYSGRTPERVLTYLLPRESWVQLLTLRQVTGACGSLTSLCSGWSIDGSA